MKTFREQLAKLGACSEATQWVGDRDLPTAWAECERADWMLWLACAVEVDRPTLVRTACAVARTVLHLIPEGENRPRVAIETAEAWCDGKATIEEVRRAARAARAADAAADAADAADAVDAAAAYAAAHAAAAAYAAAHAAAAATSAAYAAAKQHADIVRAMVPVDLIKERL